MKKGVCFLFVIALLVSSFAIADYQMMVFKSKTGQYFPTTKIKTTSTGTSGQVDNYFCSGNHSMYYQIRKTNGVEASNYVIFKGTGSRPLTYKRDGYGESMGRYGYSYRLRVAHRSQCTCNGGEIDVMIDYRP